MQNRRLISYRRARALQEGKEPHSPLAFSPRPYQPDQRLVEEIKKSQRGAFLREKANVIAQELVQAQPAAANSIARCRLTPFLFQVHSNAVVVPQLLVPQNPNRIFLEIFTSPGAAAVGNFYYSFNSPAIFNNNGSRAMVTLALNTNEKFNNAVIPQDEIWIASGINNLNSIIVIWEGVPI